MWRKSDAANPHICSDEWEVARAKTVRGASLRGFVAVALAACASFAFGAFAALAVNKRPFGRTVRLDFAALGLPERAMVRDLWRQQTLGDRLAFCETYLPAYAPLFVQIDDAHCDCD